MNEDDLRAQAAADGQAAHDELVTREQRMFDAHVADKEADTTHTLAIASRHLAVTKLYETLAAIMMWLTLLATVGIIVALVKW